MFRTRTAALACAAAFLAVSAPATHANVPATGSPDAASSSVAFTGIRPGIGLVHHRVVAGKVVPDGTPYCTANFVFQTTAGTFDPSQQLYIGTAGHCGALGNTVRALVVSPDTQSPVVVELGQIVAESDAVGSDFALIELYPSLNSWVSPAAAYVGGPTGVYTGSAPFPATLVGHGLVVGTGGTARPGVLTEFDGADFTMSVLGGGGDSGAPIITSTGLAVGVLRFAGSTNRVGVQSTGPAIQAVLPVADKPLATCAVAVPWPLPGCPPVP